MKRIGLAVMGLGLLLLVGLTACSSNQAELDRAKADNQALTTANQKLTADNQQLKLIAGPPPASLDKLYPPQSPAPVWLIEMFNLAGPMEGIGVDLQEQDMANLKPNFQAFEAQYIKMSKMVPEWTSRFPMAPVTALGTAIDSGDPSKIGPAMGAVGGVCTACHDLYLVKVEQKYHWPSFDNVKVTDPISKKELAWVDYMRAMTGSYSGVSVNLQEGQLDKARKNFDAFNLQYKTLVVGCAQCHVDATGNPIPRKYFVDADSHAMVDSLGKALAATTTDAVAIGGLNAAIGNEICLKCHLVHLQAQSAKDTWAANANLLK